MKYVVDIVETLKKTIIIEASSKEEAYENTYTAYGRQKVVLTADNFDGEKVDVLREANEADIENFELIDI